MKEALKRICIITVVMITLITVVCGEGLFPAFDKIYTVLPSFRRVVMRLPDSEGLLDNGDKQVVFSGVSQADFTEFSRYIEEYGCTLDSYTMEKDMFSAEILYEEKRFFFWYSYNAGEARLVYPAGTREEEVEVVTPMPIPTPTPSPKPTKKPTPTPAPTKKPTPTPAPTKKPTPTPTSTPRTTSSSRNERYHGIVPKAWATLQPIPTISTKSTRIDLSSTAAEALSAGDRSFRQVSTKRIAMRFSVRNNKGSKTICSYDVTFYTCNSSGSRNSSNETVTLTQNIYPWGVELCPEIFVTNQAEVYQINVAVTYVRYTDGTSESVSNPKYVTWNLRR